MLTNYFCKIDSPEKAYWLGFITADGSVLWDTNGGNYGFSIGLNKIDEEQIAQLERDLAGIRIPTVKDEVARLAWYSKDLAKSLLKRGIPVGKSYVEDLPVPQFPIRFERDFWRGLFDGDGCITTQIKKAHLLPEYRFSLAGSRPILEAFQQWGHRVARMNPQKIGRAKNQYGEANTFVFFMNGNRQIAAVLNALYEGANRYLPRKRDLFLALLKQNSERGNKRTSLRYFSPRPYCRRRTSKQSSERT